MIKRFIALLLMLVVGIQWVGAQQDSIRISLMTCAPGTEIYTLFGHTAIRYENYTRKQDLVFNYGMFSFNTPNFILRFVKGETDYKLGIIPYPYFEAEYALRGSSVYQQTLNLTKAEAEKLIDLLETNYEPQNRTYRYNYFYDNCTTRARDIIENSIDGRVTYPEGENHLSYRDIVRQYTKGHAWEGFGIDLCLGSEADAQIDARKQMFAPFYLLTALKGATILQGDSVRSLITAESKAVDVAPEPAVSGFPLSPMQSALILLAITISIAIVQLKMNKVMWGWDLILFGMQGMVGCVIAFLVFFSVHPTVGSNWLLILFNPIPLIYVPVMTYRAIKRKKEYYHILNSVCLTLFIMTMPFVQQKFNPTVLPLALCLLLCSAGHVLLYYRQNNK